MFCNTGCEHVWSNVTGVRSEGAVRYLNYDDVAGCQRACAEEVVGCVAAEYQPTTGSCWLQTNATLASQTTRATGVDQYILNASCLPSVSGGTLYNRVLGRIECMRCWIFRPILPWRGVSLSHSSSLLKRLNGSRSCLGWRVLVAQGTLYFMAARSPTDSMRPLPNYFDHLPILPVF